MDLEHVLAELRKERDALDAAIRSLERLDRVGRGDPGHWPDLRAGSPTNGATSRPASLAPRRE
jgi:hypothetical protein